MWGGVDGFIVGRRSPDSGLDSLTEGGGGGAFRLFPRNP